MGHLQVLLYLHRYLRAAPVCSRAAVAAHAAAASPSPSLSSACPPPPAPSRAAVPLPAPPETGTRFTPPATAAACAAVPVRVRRRATAPSTWDAVGAGGGGVGAAGGSGRDGCHGNWPVRVGGDVEEAACGAAEVLGHIEDGRRRGRCWWGRWQRPLRSLPNLAPYQCPPTSWRCAVERTHSPLTTAALQIARRACHTSSGASPGAPHAAVSAPRPRTPEVRRLDELLRRVEAPVNAASGDRVTATPPLPDSGAALSGTPAAGAEPPPPTPGCEGRASNAWPPLRGAAPPREVPYVPLLFRAAFQDANPHARRHAAAAAAALTAPTAADGVAVPPGRETHAVEKCQRDAPPLLHAADATAPQEPRAALRLDDIGADAVGDEEKPPGVAPASDAGGPVALHAENGVTSDDALPRGAEEQEELTAGEEGAEEDSAGDAAPASPVPSLRVSSTRRTHRLILDPVEWLAQAADAPLMDTELLETNTHVKDSLAEALTPAAAAAYAEWRRTHEAELDESGPLTAPADADVTALGYDADTAALMATASPRRVDGEGDGSGGGGDDGQDRVLQEALEAELYADVSRAIRKQQWHRASATAKAKRVRSRKRTGGAASGGEVEVALAPAEPHKSQPSPPPESQVQPAMTEDATGPKASLVTAAADDTAVATSAVEPEALVYNVFTRRVAKAGSASIRALALMGIGVNPATRELAITDESALRELADELRTHRVSWPQLWSRGALYRQLERLLSDAAVGDPVARVAGLLKLQYNKSHLQHQKPGLVVSGGGDGGAASADNNSSSSSSGSSSSGSSSAVAATTQSAMAESIEDKLLTLQDLNPEQQAVVELVMKGHNTYIGGGAGTGKSVLLRVIKQQLVREGLAVAVTGTTGIAGSQIGGCTLHHCLGINLLGEFTRRKDLASYDVIIIDEVSMLSRELFESLEAHLRRANNINLPFGGVQMILSGDFLQLGAIDSQPLITSNTFRRNFVQLKLHTVVRQNRDLRFAAQLQQLRRGLVPLDLRDSIRFMSRDEVVAEQRASAALRARQQAQLEQVLLTASSLPVDRDGACEAAGKPDAQQDAPGPAAGSDGEEDELRRSATNTPVQSTPPSTSSPRSSSGSSNSDDAVFVDGAVNLLPTNREVDATNAQQLARLGGELITYTAQILPPSLVGHWSPTYVLRIVEPARLNLKTLGLELTRHLAAFYTHGQRASASSLSLSMAATHATPPPAASGFSLAGDDSSLGASSGLSDGTWLTHPGSSDRSIVLYPLFLDALALRVRLPITMDREEARAFLAYLGELDTHLQSLRCGVSVRDVLTHADGMHTERDEYTLSQYAERAPLARPLGLKVGARVMLRTNLAPGLVNGSLGTVVAFRRLDMDQLPRYIVGNAQRETSIQQYSDFLQYEQGFDVPLVPVVDFNGRQEVIPPVTQYVGGLPNTHHYSMGIIALPLSLAYAFTVHKVQGLTLVGRVHLELSRMWPCEHLLYVAMSRVRNPEQLSVSSFHPDLVRTAADCLLFDDSLPPVAQARIAPYMLAATWRRSPGRRKKVLLRKRLEAYVRQRKQKLQREASKGDIRAEVRLLEEAMLKQRARATAAAAAAAVASAGSGQQQATEKSHSE